ncbi:MAG: MFS transporter [Thermodesulfobacteriota bacterium]
MRVDWWLTGICATRALGGMVFVTYAAALPVLQQEWGMSASAAGSIASGWQVGYAVSMVLLSWLADRIGAKPVYVWSSIIGALFSLAFAVFARSYLSGLILYTLVGTSLAGTYTTGLMILSERYPQNRRGMASGIFVASTSFGFALSLILTGIAMPIGGYRLSFLVTALGPLAAAIVIWITLSDTPVKIAPRRKGQKFTKEVLGNKPVMLLVAGYSFHNWELQGVRSWIPAFLFAALALRGVDKLNAAGFGAYITAGFHLTALLASYSMGALSDRLGRARMLITLAAASSICSFVLGWIVLWPVMAVIAVGLVYAFTTLGDSPVLSAALTEEVEPAYLGAAFGLRSLVGFGAGALAPLVFGIVLDWTNPGKAGRIEFASWGWAFSTLGLAGLGAVWAANRFANVSKK